MTRKPKIKSLYNHIQDYEFFIPPVTGALIGVLSGATIGGLPGAAIVGGAGIVCGVIDNILIKYELVSHHHLTFGIIGAAVSNYFHLPYYFSSTVGFGLGAIIPTGYLNHITATAAQPITTALIVSKYAGQKYSQNPHSSLYGAAAGALVALTDEVLINLDITENHYLSTATTVAVTFDFMAPQFNNIISSVSSLNKHTLSTYTSLTRLAFNMPYSSQIIGVSLGAYYANHGELNVLSWKPILLGQDLMSTYERIVDKKILQNRVELFVLSSTTLQITLYNLLLKDGSFTNIATLKMAGLNDESSKAQSWAGLGPALVCLCSTTITRISINHLNQILNHYFAAQMKYLVEDAINTEWLTNTTALKLSSMGSALPRLHHKQIDAARVSRLGSVVMAKAFSKSIYGLIALDYLASNNAIDMVVYAYLFNGITHKISQAIAEKIDSYQDPIRDLEALIDGIEKDLVNKAETITERGGMQYHSHKLMGLTDQLRALNEEPGTLEIVHSAWLKLKDFINSIAFKYALVGYKVMQNSLDFSKRFAVTELAIQVCDFITFEMDHMDNILNIQKAKDSINKLIDAMRSAAETKDLYSKEYVQGKLAIGFENFTVSLHNGKLLVNSLYYNLTAGIYAITGPKGSGKSSLTSKILGLEGNGILATGKIIFTTANSTQPTIVALSQNDHIPIDCSFLELVNYPQPLPTDQKSLAHLSSKVRTLWSKIGEMNISSTKEIDTFMAEDHPHNWESILSGGQKKAVFIISALLQNPDILILDETFNGLDSRSTKVIQNIIKETFADRIVLSIDHHAAENTNNFYDKCLYLINQTFEECLI